VIGLLLDVIFWRHRYRHCRRVGHRWSNMTDPIACAWCGRSSLHR